MASPKKDSITITMPDWFNGQMVSPGTLARLRQSLIPSSLRHVISRGRLRIELSDAWKSAVGSAIVKLPVKSGERALLEHLHVEKKHRGSGYGHRLLLAVNTWLKFHDLAAETWVSAFDRGPLKNAELRAWYIKHGWKADERKGYRKNTWLIFP